MRPVSELKAIARRRLSKHNGIMISATALMLLMILTLVMAEAAIMVMGVDPGSAGSIEELMDAFAAPEPMLMSFALSIIVSLLAQLVYTGYRRMCLTVASDLKPSLADLFFPFKYNPDKIIILGFLVWAASSLGGVRTLVDILTGGISSGNVSGGAFFAGMLLEVFFAALMILVNAYMFPAYYIYLEDPEKPVIDIIRESIAMMRGNVLRFIYLTLTFAGWFVLVLFTYGIALIYVAPYLNTAYSLFYRDLKGETGNGYYSEA